MSSRMTGGFFDEEIARDASARADRPRATTDLSPRRRIDFAGLALMLVGLVFGAISYWLITYRGSNVLLIVPSIVAATTGATHLTKWQAPRDLPDADSGSDQ
ncbi:MAG: hypothetical protein WKF57_06555 [Nakamurella sp.]